MKEGGYSDCQEDGSSTSVRQQHLKTLVRWNIKVVLNKSQTLHFFISFLNDMLFFILWTVFFIEAI